MKSTWRIQKQEYEPCGNVTREQKSGKSDGAENIKGAGEDSSQSGLVTS